MAATEPGAVRLHPRVVRRNIIASAVNHFFVEGSMTLSEGGTVLPLMVRTLGGSTFLAGLLPSLQFMGWLMPQFLAAGRLQRLTRFTSAVQALEAMRASFLLAIAGLVLALGRSHPQVVLACFFPLYLITRVAAGASAVARSEIVARMVPAEERATAISARQLGGGIAALLAGLAVRYVLDERVSAFPANYATLLGLSALGFGVAIAVLGLVREAELAIKPRVIDAWGQIKRAPTLLRREPRYALYLAQRATATGLEAVAPFYIIYATEVLGAPAAAAGVYIAVRTGVRVLSNLFWGRACKRLGSVWVLRAATALAALAPATAVLLALTAGGGGRHWQGHPVRGPVRLGVHDPWPGRLGTDDRRAGLSVRHRAGARPPVLLWPHQHPVGSLLFRLSYRWRATARGGLCAAVLGFGDDAGGFIGAGVAHGAR